MSKKNSLERKMKEDNEHVQRTIAEDNGQSRREFILTSALAVAGAGAAGILNPARAFGAESKNPSGQGNGPYPTEGMAAYSETGPLKLMKFERRALGANDVAIKIHYWGVCQSYIHTVRVDW